jgi:hypothetical protein
MILQKNCCFEGLEALVKITGKLVFIQLKILSCMISGNVSMKMPMAVQHPVRVT